MNKLVLTVWLLTMGLTAQAQFTCTTNNGQITITRYTGTNLNVTIPGTINNYPVTAIGAGAFAQGIGFDIQSVTMSNNIVDIGEFAFQFCIMLTNLNLPDTLQNIESSAFDGCYRLPKLQIPDSVTCIGSGAFVYCTNLTELTLGNNITNLGPEAFFGCYRIPKITIPNNVTSIGDEAFELCWTLTTITIPPNVTNLGTGAFRGCSSLKTICFQCNASTNFGQYMFDGAPFGQIRHDPITNIFYASGTTGWSNSFQGIPTIPCPECNDGAIQIWVEPTNAVNDGALWQIDDGNLEINGAIVAVPPGDHTIRSSILPGWYNPPNQTIRVSAGLLTTVTLTYQQPGALQINITPAAATVAGAQWSIDEITWHNNGDTLTNLEPTNYTVAFNDLAGWGTPDEQIITINANQTTEATGLYLPYGTMQLTMTAPSIATNLQSNQCYLRAAVLPNQPYQVEYTESLSDPNWMDLGPVLTSTNNVLRISDTTGQSTRFYRVIQQ